MTTDSLSSMRSASSALLGDSPSHQPVVSTLPSEKPGLATLPPPSPWTNKEQKVVVSGDTISPTGISLVLDPSIHYVHILNFAVALWPSVQPNLGLDRIYVVPKSVGSSNQQTKVAKTTPAIPIRVGEMLCARWSDVGWVFPLNEQQQRLLEVEVKISRSLLPDESLGKVTIDLASVSRTRLTQCRVEFEGGFFTATLRMCPSFAPPDLVARRHWYHRLFACLPLRSAYHKKSQAQKKATVLSRAPRTAITPVRSLDCPMYPEWKRRD